MPLTHWACPPERPTYGQVHEPDFCITECPHKCASPFLIAALTQANRRNHHKGKYISATSLSGCVRKLTFERTVPYASPMKMEFYSYRGTVMHQVVEDSLDLELSTTQEDLPVVPSQNGKISMQDMGYEGEWTMLVGFCFKHGGFEVDETVNVFDEATWDNAVCPECRRERRPYKDREMFLLGGTLDGLEPFWDQFDPDEGTLYGDLWDLKTAKEYAAGYFIKGDDKNTYHKHVKDAYFEQANVYKYLLHRSKPTPTLQKLGVKRVRLRNAHIQLFTMGEFPRTGQPYRWRAHWKHEYSNWDIPPIEFKDDDWIEEYIKVRAKPIYESLVLQRHRGTICEPEKNSQGLHSWICGYCPAHKSSYCPAPDVEWEALEAGLSEKEAFEQATKSAAKVQVTA